MENSNNDNNLFTNMFGIESEEEPLEQPVPQTVPEQQIVQQPVMNQGVPQQPEMQSQMNQSTQPQEQEIIFLDSTPTSIPQEQEIQQPSFESNSSQMDYNIPNINTLPTNEEFTGFEEGTQNFKWVYVAFGVILAILIIGFPLYSVIDNILHPVPNANIGSSNNNDEEKTTTVTEKEPEKPKEEVKPIIFDTTLSFDKGYTTNNDELYQTTAFKPISTEGVIKCEHIKSYKTSTYIEKGIVYIYYRDSRAKKVLTSTNQQYTSTSDYNKGLTSYALLKQQIEANKNAEVLIRTSQKDKLIQANVLIDMAYGKTLKFDGTNLNYFVVFSYDAPINDAMNKVLNNQVNKGNMACSTIVTNDASI